MAENNKCDTDIQILREEFIKNLASEQAKYGKAIVDNMAAILQTLQTWHMDIVAFRAAYQNIHTEECPLDDATVSKLMVPLVMMVSTGAVFEHAVATEHQRRHERGEVGQPMDDGGWAKAMEKLN